MSLRAASLTALILASRSPAQSSPPPPESPKEHAVTLLFAERGDHNAFERTAVSARSLHVPDQVILEARFLYLVDKHDDKSLAALLPDLLQRKDSFRLEDSEVFAVKEDWLAVIEFVQAVDALQHDNRDSFKHHITEAFWLSPRQGSAFAPHIERLRIDDAMRGLHLDLNTSYRSLDHRAASSLGNLLHGQKALLLQFWTPWNHECEQRMPDFLATASALAPHHIATAAILADSSEKAASDARNSSAQPDQNHAARWLVDQNGSPLARSLRIRDLPAVVLILPDGSIRFNGTPDDPALWNTLRSIAPDFQRPHVRPDPHSAK